MRQRTWFWIPIWVCGLIATVQAEPRLDLEFDQIPLHTALQMIAQQAGANLVMTATGEVKVNARLKGVTLERALEMLTLPYGLGFRKVGDCYVVGTSEQLKTLDPPAPSQPPQLVVYPVRFVAASNLMNLLKALYPELSILPGIPPAPPRMDDGGVGASPTAGGNPSPLETQGGQGLGKPAGTVPSGSEPIQASANLRSLLFYGPPSLVEAALQTARQLDRPPIQIKIEVIVTDISRNSLRELGLEWNWGKLTWQEIVRKEDQLSIANQTLLKPSDKGGFWRAPITLEATLKALEQKGHAKLLAHPSVSVLDGETAQILIGERVLYPVVAGTTTAGTPLFDVREQAVGIVLQVRAMAESGGTLTLDIYPQVSVITGFLKVGDSSFPQIATREIRTKIRVKSGSQIALGGLIRDEETHLLQKVPILSKLPILGELFKSRRKSTTQNELVIFLKPEIIPEGE